MKKILCILSIALLLFTGCGNKHIGVVLDDDDEVNYYENTVVNTAPTKPKRAEQPTTQADIAPGNTDIPCDTNVCVTSTDGTGTTDSSQTTIQTDVLSEGDSSIEVPETDLLPEDDNPEPTTEENQIDVYYLDGIVYNLSDRYISIIESDFGKINVTFSDTSLLSDIKIGDTVEITYNGLINSGYVSYAYDAYSVEIINKAEKNYEMQSFEYNGKKFSLLVPEDWSSRVIEYLQEGDFTDWGIRFTPDDMSGSMDISWHSAFQVVGGMTKIKKVLYNREVIQYSLSGIWRFVAFDDGYIAANNFQEAESFERYRNEMDLMLTTLEIG